MDLYKTASDIVNSITPMDESIIRNLGFGTYLREFRTYMLQVPRRVGKTTTITSLSNDLSALTYCKYPLVTNAYKYNASLRDGYPLRGYYTKGLKYQCILLDEYDEIPHEVYKTAAELRIHGVMTHNFFILGLCTPVRHNL